MKTANRTSIECAGENEVQKSKHIWQVTTESVTTL